MEQGCAYEAQRSRAYNGAKQGGFLNLAMECANIFNGGKAQGDNDHVNHGIHRDIKIFTATKQDVSNAKFEKLLDAGKHKEIGRRKILYIHERRYDVIEKVLNE